MANLALSHIVAADRVVLAPIDLKEHPLFSTAAVLMPGPQLPGVRPTPAKFSGCLLYSGRE